MDDIFGSLWDRFPETRSRPYYYSQNPKPDPNPYAFPYAPDYFYQPQPVAQPAPRVKPRSFSVPVSDDQNPTKTSNRANEFNSSGSKPKNVVSVPVKFASSDAPSNDEKKAVADHPSIDERTAAVRIQKAFRGFSVRKSAPLKNLNIIAKARAEGEDIRKRIGDEKVVDLLRREEKERLKILEGIMSLLLKLDAIQGVNYVVREYRKAATRELVNLQETVDAIIAGKPMKEELLKGDTLCTHTEDKTDILDKKEETPALEEEIKDQHRLDNPKEVDYVDDAGLRDSKPCEMQTEESQPTQMHDLKLEGSYETEQFCSSQSTDNSAKLEKVRLNTSGSDNGMIADMLETEAVQGNENIKAEDKNVEDEEVVDATIADTLETKTVEGDENIKVEDKNMEDEGGVDETGTGDGLSAREEVAEDTGMVREENKRLKTMVADLLKKSEKQSQMIDNLSSRIAQLEEQVSKKKKIAEQRKKTRALTDVVLCAGNESENDTTTVTDERMPQPHEWRRRKMNKQLNGLKEDRF